MTRNRLTIPVEFVRTHQRDMVMLLRLGAGANAMEVAQRLLLRIGRKENRPVTMLARVQCAFIAIGYWREVVKMIEKERWDDRLWALVQCAIEDGIELGCSLAEARDLFSPAHPELGGSTLLKVRDKIGFHWDPQPFEAFLQDLDTNEVTLWESDGDRNSDRIFLGSSDAMSHYFFGIPGEGGKLEELLPLVAKAQGLLGPVVEAGYYGLLVESGVNPQDHWQSSDEA